MSKRYEDRSFFQRILFSKLHKGRFNYLEIGDNDAVAVKYHVFKPKERAEKVDLDELSFFDMEKRKVIFGDENNIEWKRLKPAQTREIRDEIMSKSTKFNQLLTSVEGKAELVKYKMRGRNLWQWIVCKFTHEEEYIQLSDNAIIHRRESKNGARNSYIPYDKLDYAGFQKKYFLLPFLFRREKVFATGSLEFSTKYYIKGSEADVLRKEISKHLKMVEGKTYHPNIFSGVKKRHSYTLTLMEDKAIYIHNEDVVVIRDIEKFKGSPFFSLFKRVAYIDGYSGVNQRDKSVGVAYIEFPGVGFFTWYGIKSRLKKIKKYYKTHSTGN